METEGGVKEVAKGVAKDEVGAEEVAKRERRGKGVIEEVALRTDEEVGKEVCLLAVLRARVRMSRTSSRRHRA